MTPAQKAIYNAVAEVEKMESSPILSDIQLKLKVAYNELTSYLDNSAQAADSTSGDPSAPPVGPGH